MIWNAGSISQIRCDTRGGNAHKNSAIRGGRQTHDEIRAAAVAGRKLRMKKPQMGRRTDSTRIPRIVRRKTAHTMPPRWRRPERRSGSRSRSRDSGQCKAIGLSLLNPTFHFVSHLFPGIPMFSDQEFKKPKIQFYVLMVVNRMKRWASSLCRKK